MRRRDPALHWGGRGWNHLGGAAYRRGRSIPHGARLPHPAGDGPGRRGRGGIRAGCLRGGTSGRPLHPPPHDGRPSPGLLQSPGRAHGPHGPQNLRPVVAEDRGVLHGHHHRGSHTGAHGHVADPPRRRDDPHRGGARGHRSGSGGGRHPPPARAHQHLPGLRGGERGPARGGGRRSGHRHPLPPRRAQGSASERLSGPCSPLPEAGGRNPMGRPPGNRRPHGRHRGPLRRGALRTHGPLPPGGLGDPASHGRCLHGPPRSSSRTGVRGASSRALAPSGPPR